jgi:hypothetical protein
MLLGYGHAAPPQFARNGIPKAAIGSLASLDEPAHRFGRGTFGQKSNGFVADQALVIGQNEIHGLIEILPGSWTAAPGHIWPF